MKNIDVLIIGGGAAGLTAALSASMQGAKTMILEAAPRIGRKILASGNGRCNLANAGEPRLYGNQRLAQGVLREEDFPLLMHIYEIIVEKKPVNVPWKKFEKEIII